MDLLDFLNNLGKVSNGLNLIVENFKRFTDTKEYKGERVKSFIAFTLLTFWYVILIFAIVFAIYTLFKST